MYLVSTPLEYSGNRLTLTSTATTKHYIQNRSNLWRICRKVTETEKKNITVSVRVTETDVNPLTPNDL
jgi:glutamine synthetase